MILTGAKAWDIWVTGLRGGAQIETSILRMLNSGLNYGGGRAATIYIENHHHCRFTLKAGGRPFWYLTQPHIIALFTCSGATLIYNGQEYGADNDVPEDGGGRVVPRALDWNALKAEPGPPVRGVYQKMMAIRILGCEVPTSIRIVGMLQQLSLIQAAMG